MDDYRLQLPHDNIFRFYAQNHTADVSAIAEELICLRTAAEIEAERQAAKATLSC